MSQEWISAPKGLGDSIKHVTQGDGTLAKLAFALPWADIWLPLRGELESHIENVRVSKIQKQEGPTRPLPRPTSPRGVDVASTNSRNDSIAGNSAGGLGMLGIAIDGVIIKVRLCVPVTP